MTAAPVPLHGDQPAHIRDGSDALRRRAASLASTLPESINGLATLAFNYRFSWVATAREVLEVIDPDRWERCQNNPVRLLQEVERDRLTELGRTPTYIDAVKDACAEMSIGLRSEPGRHGLPREHPVAFLCSEFGIHRSLPIYSGGLGILAGDILKEASDLDVAMVGVGLMYAQGYCRQHIDKAGRQQEYWVATDPDRTPAAIVTDTTGAELRIHVGVGGHDVAVRVWRVDVGRTPLYLLDTDVPENDHIDRWITARLYVGDRRLRLAQYTVLGVGGMLALAAMGIEPGALHINEGHPALAPLHLVHVAREGGISLEQALTLARSRTIFTTHTPVAAGNEVYGLGEIAEVITDPEATLGVSLDALAEISEADGRYAVGMTPLGLRVSSRANAVSARHGQVARAMWDRLEEGRRIGHVTNGVHVPTWMGREMTSLLHRHLPEGWEAHLDDPATWTGVGGIPDEELWAVRCAMRGRLVSAVRQRVVNDRLSRGEPVHHAAHAAGIFDEHALVIGLARRLAPYKRTALLVRDRERLRHILDGQHKVQLLVAGKAHPADEWGKAVGQEIVAAGQAPEASGRLVFLSDYEMGLGALLVAGADIWLNMPRPPMEASGTSGMKAVLNGGLNLSVLDGWWEEAFDGGNGWGVATAGEGDEEQDAHDAQEIYRLLEDEVVPEFHDRGPDGIPHGWCARVKRSMMTCGWRFSATRMVREYVAAYADVGRGAPEQ